MISLPMAMLVGVVCVCVEAFFSGSEIAMVSANKTKLRQRSTSGDRRAKMVEALLARPERLLATTLLGTNLATVTFSVTVALAVATSFDSPSELLAIALVTPMTLILGEVIPKTLFQQHADALVGRLVVPLRFAEFVLLPGVVFMSLCAASMTRLLGTRGTRPFVTRDALEMLIEQEEASDTEISQEERQMIVNVFELGELVASDVMVPLSEVAALDENVSLREAALEIADKQHSRMPVYRQRIDDIVGVVHVFDLLQASDDPEQSVGNICRSAKFVPENMPAVDLLVDLQKDGHHMTMVVDEYGGAIGIVTVEDLLEEVVGEIDDEYDKEPSPIRLERPGVWRMEGKTAVDRICEELSVVLPESEDYETIAGLVLQHFRKIPQIGESMVIGNLTIRVVHATDRAIEEVQLLRTRRRL